ncbi:MAG: isopentenyl phosphate kinase [Candidatus Thorarchaeota archaeon]
MTKLTLLKLGGSVITRKELTPPVINEKIVARIANEIKSYSSHSLLIVLGGGAHGHQAAHKYGFGSSNTAPTKLISGIPLIRHNMTVLSLGIESILESNGVKSVVIPPFASAILENGKIQRFNLDVFHRTLAAEHIIITHGDVCYDSIRGASILSGDTILAFLTKQLDIDRVLVGTNVDGLLDSDPEDNPNAKVIPIINDKNKEEVLEIAGPASTTDVTGGMRRKISDLLTISESGVEVIIFNLTVAGRLSSLLQGSQALCTRIRV